MDIQEALKKVAVVGAAGKMGQGIAFLLLQEMARSEAENYGSVRQARLILIDSHEDALKGLKKYLRQQITKYAEKNINALRKYYANNSKLVSNEEIIEAFVEGALDLVTFSTELPEAKHAHLVFEAIIEDLSAKTTLFSTLKSQAQQPQFYFTNTSSIPISLINDSAHLENRVIGFHFYNPPVIQRLIEIITPTKINPHLKSIALELAKRLQKKIVMANDVAGFVGNGHFMRELVFASQQAINLARQKNIPLEQAVLAINYITEKSLLRPMGIFQTADYVGLDVCTNILKIMNTHLPDPSLMSSLLSQMMQQGITGGQNQDGTQKNGFFLYEGHHPIKVWSFQQKTYLPIADFKIEKFLDAATEKTTWKKLQQDGQKKEKILTHFKEQFSKNTIFSELTKTLLQQSAQIEKQLLDQGVVTSIKEIDTVLENGFFHLYSPFEISAKLGETHG